MPVIGKERLSASCRRRTDGRPVTQWPDRDQAFLEVARAIRGAAARFSPSPVVPANKVGRPPGSGSTTTEPLNIRSSNLRVAKHFTELLRIPFNRKHLNISRSFSKTRWESSQPRNTGIERDLRRIDANRFTAVITAMGSPRRGAPSSWAEALTAGVSRTPISIPGQQLF